MSIILGLNAYHPGASAALIVDGQPVAAVAEERLNRIKNFGGYPYLAVEECFRIAGIGWESIDTVSIGRDPRANYIEKLLYSLSHIQFSFNFASILKRRHSLSNIRNLIQTTHDVDPTLLRFSISHVEHHLAHTASAYFASPWDKSAGFTVDGSGDFVTCMMSSCEGPNIQIKKKIFSPHSIGSLYTAICQFIGYGTYGDEGKVMGLAPLGNDTYSDFMNKISNTENGTITNNQNYFHPFGSTQGMQLGSDGSINLDRHYSVLMETELGEPRKKGAPLTQRDTDLASSLQRQFEQSYLSLIRSLSEMVPDNRIAIAGGCALNSVANGKIFTDTRFSETFIQPAAGDDGLALGSALYVSNSVLREGNRWTMENSFLGPEYSDTEIESELIKHDINYEKLNCTNLIRQTVEELTSGMIVGWFQGRMEWGPRALGNRSILAHPGLPDMKDKLNSRIKDRESFRPFAPAVLHERQSDIFEQEHPSPFMLHVYGIKPAWREQLCAVNHVDNTGRLQSVKRNENPLFYDLIEAFYKKTDIPVLLNTSFNENEPIVCRPSEAINCFSRTKMDALVMGSFFCKKRMS